MIHEKTIDIKRENFIECPYEFDPKLKFDDPAPRFRKSFNVSIKPESAVLTVCGIGYGNYFLNGNRFCRRLF